MPALCPDGPAKASIAARCRPPSPCPGPHSQGTRRDWFLICNKRAPKATKLRRFPRSRARLEWPTSADCLENTENAVLAFLQRDDTRRRIDCHAGRPARAPDRRPPRHRLTVSPGVEPLEKPNCRQVDTRKGAWALRVGCVTGIDADQRALKSTTSDAPLRPTPDPYSASGRNSSTLGLLLPPIVDCHPEQRSVLRMR
jgi:hypothetical protein